MPTFLFSQSLLHYHCIKGKAHYVFICVRLLLVSIVFLSSIYPTSTIEMASYQWLYTISLYKYESVYHKLATLLQSDIWIGLRIMLKLNDVCVSKGILSGMYM